MNFSNLDKSRIGLFIIFVLVFVSVEVFVLLGLDIPQELTTALSTISVALVGLFTNTSKDNE